MITTQHQATPKAAARVYKLLSRDVGPAENVRHFGPHTLYAQFGPFTYTSKAVEGEDFCSLCVYFHDEEEEANMDFYHDIVSRVNVLCAEDADVLDPFN